MSVSEVLAELGGVASRSTLVRHTSRAAFDRAARSGDIVRIAVGRYALPQADAGLRAAHALSGTLSMTSAAMHWGWEVKQVPDLPHVTVPTKRKLARERRRKVHLHRADLLAEDVRDGVTSPELTLAQCLRCEPWDSALAVADSALRHGLAPATLAAIARDASGPGSAQIRRVAKEASGLAANPFESVLRAIALDVPGLAVLPQRPLDLGHLVRPDLVDESLRIVLEADSFQWHGHRAALRRDAERYNAMVVAGWTVLRFSWEDVMHDQWLVRTTMERAVHLARRRSEALCARCCAA